MDIATIIITSSFSVVIGGIVTYRVSYNLERLKGEIQRNLEHDKKALEIGMKPLHAQVERIEFEHQAKFTTLHEKRFEVIAGLYERLVAMESLLGPYGAFYKFGEEDPPAEKFLGEATQQDHDFWMYYQRNRYWFDQSLCLLIDEVQSVIATAIMRKNNYLNVRDKSTDQLADQYSLTAGFSQVNDEKNKIDTLKESIIDILRKTLGVERDDALVVRPEEKLDRDE